MVNCDEVAAIARDVIEAIYYCMVRVCSDVFYSMHGVDGPTRAHVKGERLLPLPSDVV